MPNSFAVAKCASSGATTSTTSTPMKSSIELTASGANHQATASATTIAISMLRARGTRGPPRSGPGSPA